MLPINFHRTFVPERRLIGALLHYAALGKEGTYQEISAETGIPMGESTGKVPAILDYARGMGLVTLGQTEAALSRRPMLTPLGQAVYAMDRYLGETLTQWVAHLNLCRADIGARTWRAAFVDGYRVLGSRFTRDELESYLANVFGGGNERTGPLIRTYDDEAALGRAGVLGVSTDAVERRSAPLLDSYATAYSAVALELMETCFPGQMQVTLSDLNATTGWFEACLWGPEQVERLCALLDRKGLVTVDRQMRPWILDKRAVAEGAWPSLFDDIA